MIKPIRNAGDLQSALDRIDELWGAERGTPEGDELDVLVTLVQQYELEHVKLPPGDPVKLIEYKLRELGLSREAFSERLGWNISLILNRRRELTLKEARQIRVELNIPRDCFL